MKVKSENEVTQSCPTLSNPMDWSLPGSSIHGIFQARVLEWGAIAFSREINEMYTNTFSLFWLIPSPSWFISVITNPSLKEGMICPKFGSNHWQVVMVVVVVCDHREPVRILCPWHFPGKNTTEDCHFSRGSSQQGWNQHLLHCRWILYCWATREAHIGKVNT